MCLSKVDATYDKPSDLIVDGWKEFAGGTASPLSFYNFGGAVPIDKWISASDIKTPTGDIKASSGQTYRPGFHIYSDESQVKKEKRYSCRVYFRRVTCTGEQDGMKCVVAQEMYVPSSPDAWPPLPLSAVPSTGAPRKLIDRLKGGKRK